MNFQTRRLLISRFRVRDPGGSPSQNPLDKLFPSVIYSRQLSSGGASGLSTENNLLNELNKGGGSHEDTGPCEELRGRL